MIAFGEISISGPLRPCMRPSRAGGKGTQKKEPGGSRDRLKRREKGDLRGDWTVEMYKMRRVKQIKGSTLGKTSEKEKKWADGF